MNNHVNYEQMMCVFTDGSALSNKKSAPAGWAMLIPHENKLISKGMFGTNNQAELEAIRYSLWYLKEHNVEHKYDTFGDIYIMTDSEYSINAITGKHKSKVNTAKIKVCQLLINELSQMNITINFIHVDAHTGGKDYVSINNDIVDKTARKRAMEMQNIS